MVAPAVGRKRVWEQLRSIRRAEPGEIEFLAIIWRPRTLDFAFSLLAAALAENAMLGAI